MSEPDEQDELQEPTVADVPEPDQPSDDDTAEEEAHEAENEPQERGEPPEAQGVPPEVWEKRFQRADRAFQAYSRKIGDIFEEDANDLIPFTLSQSAPPGFINKHDAGRVDEQIKAAALDFLGFAREQDYEPDPEARECPTCKGKGKTKTGSHVAGKETRACPRCLGSGAEGLGAQQLSETGNGRSTEPFTLAEPSSALAADADNWGEPRILPDGRENPNYGKMPQFKITVEPYGVTANLTSMDAAV